MLTTNTLLQNKYRIDTRLEQGEIETLYRAIDTQSNRPVIIIQMSADAKLDPNVVAELRQQLRQEAKVLTLLKHPNLVGVIEFFEESDEAYLVTEYIEGEDLASRIERAGQLPEAQVVTWAAQLLDALAYCHSQSIIHRDIKPQNIIIQPDGQAVLGGFGLIKLRSASTASQGQKMPVTGTVPYASPEQYAIRSLQELDERSDLYSLGATLYHALTGQRPPSASDRSSLSVSAASLFQSLTGRELSSGDEKTDATEISMQNHNPDVSPATEAVVIQAMAISRSDRYANARKMRAALPALTEQKSVPVWAWGAVAVILIIGLVGGGWWFLGPATTPSSPSSSPTAETGLAVAPSPTVETGLAVAPSSTPVAAAPDPPTNTSVPTDTVTAVPESPTDTSAPTDTAAPIPADTPTPLPTDTPTPLPTDTPTPTPTSTSTPTPTDTPAPTPTDTPTATSTPTATPSITIPGISADFIQTRSGDETVMVYVPAGEFVMGSSPADGDDNEQPQHIVTLDAYWIDAHEITNAQFAAFLNEADNQTEGGTTWLRTNDENIHIQQNGNEWGPSPGYEDHPVIGVNWYGARAYCLWYGARLPTEAEWEKAARGTNGQLYPWGNTPPSCDLGNYWVEDSCVDDTTAVGSYMAGRSPFGALDMAGNVWEWVSDWYEGNYYTNSPTVNPLGPQSGSTKVIRSGSWSNLGSFARAGFRGFFDPANMNYNVGFRCAQD